MPELQRARIEGAAAAMVDRRCGVVDRLGDDCACGGDAVGGGERERGDAMNALVWYWLVIRCAVAGALDERDEWRAEMAAKSAIAPGGAGEGGQ